MYVKTYKTEKHFMVAACDSELIGCVLENDACSITVNASFYKGEEADEETVTDLLYRATTANLVGKKTVECAVNSGLIDPESIIYFGDIPHVLYFTI